EVADQRPWTERYEPMNLDELAVHKRKVLDVRKWLHDVFEGRERKRLLLLKGPAGSGKTTTMSLLADDLGFMAHEWKNPANTAFGAGAVSMTAQFEDFIGRTGKFGSLQFQDTVQPQAKPEPAMKKGREKEVIIVEEFPNTFTPSSASVQAFRSSIQQFLAVNTPSMGAFLARQKDLNHPVTPMILIISETLLSTNTAAADSFTAHRLLGPEILNHPAVTTIEFNPIAPTLMAKALELVVKKEARKTGRRKTAGPQVIQRLSEVGDIRSAVSSLEFLCVRGDDQDGWGAKVAFTKPKKSGRDTTLTKMEQESLEIITQRESTLGIFHAVGKVVHNKRDAPNTTSEPIPQPPNYFPELRRPKLSQVHVDELIDDLGTDIQTFIAALHENYLLSCDGGSPEDTMDSINGCIDALSDADLLSPDRFGSGAAARLTFQGTTADNLRQDELSFQVSVRGLLFSLPSPVKRITPPPGTASSKGKTGSRTSAFSMFYPTSLRIWRQREEIEGLLDMWIGRAQSGQLFAPLLEQVKKRDSKVGGVESWRRNGSVSRSTETRSDQPSRTKTEEEPSSVLLGSGSSAKHEMLLERLPYIALVMRNRISATKSGSLREVEKVTAFHGIGGSSEEALDDDDGNTDVEQWSTDPPTAQGRKSRRPGQGTIVKNESMIPTSAVESDVAKLVLSDDDIEDD
ncbi:Rad17-domain-containing protein, partial [Lophium mytilinum]